MVVKKSAILHTVYPICHGCDMITIQHIINQLVSREPEEEKLLREGMLNMSAYAKKIKPVVDEYALRDVKINSIVAALRRLSLPTKTETRVFDTNSYMRIYTHIFILTIMKSFKNFTLLNPYPAQAFHDKEYFNYVTGADNITIVSSKKYHEELNNLFPEKLRELSNAGVIVLKITDYADTTPSLVYHLVRELHARSINILDMVTGATQIDFYLAEKDLMTAGEEFRKLLDKTRGIPESDTSTGHFNDKQ